MTRTIIQLYRGTTAQNDAFTGSVGELSFDTTTNQVRVHDGSTAGGHIIGSGGSSSGYHPDLFDVKWADHICNDVQWLRADTFSWQSGAVYQAAYAHLTNDILSLPENNWSIPVRPAGFDGVYWNCIAWDGSKFVVLSQAGHISTSTDGVTWAAITQPSNPGNHTWQCMCYNGIKFVTLGNTGYVSTSTDGTTWTTATQNANLGTHGWESIAWDGSKFVALGSGGYVSTSTDGTTWSTAIQNANLSSVNTNHWNLAWDGSKFVAISVLGHISTSTDGTTWSVATQNTNLGENAWWAIAWDGSKFFALGFYGHISTSADGINWTIAEQDANLGNNSWVRVAFSGSRFVALGEYGYVSYLDSVYQTETIAGITITYYLAEDGHKLVLPDQESNVTAIYNATGVAWYYIIDTTNQRFKLPRTKFGFTGIRNGVGDYVEAGLPNITGDFGSVIRGKAYNTANPSMYANNAFRIINRSSLYNEYAHVAQSQGNNHEVYGYILDASNSSSTYGNSDTVQPKATEMYLYFYVGNFTQTALENTAGLNAELFNGKVDTDFSNTSMIDYVIEKQDPTAANNYTWYRKYQSGWVEQGGRIPGNVGGTYNVSMPVEMADTNYNFIGTGYKDSNDNGFVAACIDTTSMTTTGFRVYTRYAINGSTGSPSQGGQWQVSGMAA